MKSEDYPDWEMYQEIMKCAAQYVGVPLCRKVREFEVKPYPQRLFILSDLLKQFILREIGDIKRYLQMDDKLSLFKYEGKKAHVPHSHDRCVRQIMEWLNFEMDKIDVTIPQEENLIISLLVWGREYTIKMIQSTFASMMAKDNLPAIAKEINVTIYIQTDKKTSIMLEQMDVVKQMKKLGVTFDYAIIPDRLIEMMKNDMETYWMVGAAASAALYYAKHMKAAFHHSYPDIIYSENYFSELLKLSKKHNNILAPGARSDEGLMMRDLERYEKDNVISIPASDLASLHLNNNHIAWWGKLVNNRERLYHYPLSHTLMWESEDTLYYNTPHLNAVWLSYKTLEPLPRRYYMTLDSELERICIGDDFYIPQNDDLYLVELSEQGRAKIDEAWGGIDMYIQYMWENIAHRDLLKFAICGMKVKLNRKIRPKPLNVFPNKQIKLEIETLFNSIIQKDPYKEVGLKRTHENKITDSPLLISMR